MPSLADPLRRFSGAVALKADLEKVIKLWKLSRQQLNARVQRLWAAGYRPGQGGSLETPAWAAALMRRTLNRPLKTNWQQGDGFLRLLMR